MRRLVWTTLLVVHIVCVQCIRYTPLDLTSTGSITASALGKDYTDDALLVGVDNSLRRVSLQGDGTVHVATSGSTAFTPEFILGFGNKVWIALENGDKKGKISVCNAAVSGDTYALSSCSYDDSTYVQRLQADYGSNGAWLVANDGDKGTERDISLFSGAGSLLLERSYSKDTHTQKEVHSVACTQNHCLFSQDDTCESLVGWVRNGNVLTSLDGDSWPFKDCLDRVWGVTTPNFEIKRAYDMLACGSSYFVKVVLDTPAGELDDKLVQFNMADVVANAPNQINGVVRDLGDVSDVALSCHGNYLVATHSEGLVVAKVMSGTTLEFVADLERDNGFHSPVLTGSMLAVLDNDDKLHIFTEVWTVSSLASNVTCTDGEAPECETAATLGTWNLPLQVEASGNSFVRLTNAGSGWSLRSDSGAGTWPLDVTLVLTETTSATLELASSADFTDVRASLLLSAELRAPSMLLPTLPIMRVGTSSTGTLSTASIANLASATVNLQVTVTLPLSDARLVAADGSATNSVSGTVVPGGSFSVMFSADGGALGLRAVYLTVTSNDPKTPTAQLAWQVSSEVEQFLVMFPSYPDDVRHGLMTSSRLAPGMSEVARLSMINMRRTGTITISFSAPAVPWLKLTSTPSGNVDPGSLSTALLEFTHAQDFQSPTAIGEQSTTLVITAATDIDSQTFDLDLVVDLVAGPLVPASCKLLYTSDRLETPPASLRVGEAYTVIVEMYDELGHPTASFQGGTVRPSDVSVEISGVQVTKFLSGSGTEMEITLQPMVKGDVTLGVLIDRMHVLGSPTAVIPIEPLLCNSTVSLPSSDGAQCRCLAGYYMSEATAPLGSGCRMCAPGKSQASVGQAQCMPCDSGSYSPVRGAKNCQQCPADSYTPPGTTDGASECISCGVESVTGMAPNEDQTACQCVAGWTESEPGSGECTLCGKGNYKPTAGPMPCSPCNEPNMIPAANATMCLPCPTNTTARPGDFVCKSCSPGFYIDAITGDCEACEVNTANSDPILFGNGCPVCTTGTVALTKESPSCTPCPAGTRYANQQCELCPEGMWSASRESQCHECGTGSYSTANRTTCISCPAGTFKGVGMSLCQSCPSGQWSAAKQDSCSPCQDGWIAINNGTECVACSAGTHAVNGTACVACDEGLWSPAAQLSCQTCPNGFVGSANHTVCLPCAAGQYRGASDGECLPCSAGSISEAGKASCVVCGSGEVSTNSETECSKCPAGTHKDPSSNDCLTCDDGKWSREGLDSCTLCNLGFVSSANRTTCLPCDAGTFKPSGEIACSPCAEGFISAAGKGVCSPCSPGTISVANQTACEMCPSGTFKTPGANSCTECDVNKWSDAGAESCKSCAEGYVSRANNTGCVPCDAGYHRSSTAEECSLCPDGTWSAAGRGQCTPCEDGHVSTEDRTVCLPCAAGMYRPEGKLECEKCEAGTWSAAGSDECDACPPGSIHVANRTTCVSCGVGEYEVQNQLCVPCTGNKYSVGRQRSCIDCPAGFVTEDHIECLPCYPGTVQVGSECQLCPDGQVMPSLNGTTCIPCTAPRVPHANRQYCVTCEPGTYAVSNIRCQSCRAGTYNFNPSAIECTPCAKGTFASKDKMSTCQLCSEGFYSAGQGASECDRCPANTFSDVGAEACTPCPDSSTGDTGVQCQSGRVTFLEGYWRPEAAQVEPVKASTVFFKCEDGACKTDPVFGNVSCAAGNTGPMCGVCKPNHAKASGICTKCWDPPVLSWMATAGTASLVAALVCFFVSRSTGKRNEVVAIARILLNYFQLNSAIGTFALKAPGLAREFLNLSSAADGISLNAFFVQCSFAFTYYQLLTLYCALPFLVALVAAVVFMVLYLYRKHVRPQTPKSMKKLWKHHLDKLKLTCVLVTMLLYTRVSREVLNVFEVTEPINGVHYIKTDVSAQAYTSSHIGAMIVGIISIIVFVLGVPAATIIVLKRTRHKVGTSVPFRRKYGVLFDGFDESRGWQWWEAVVMMRKVAVTAIAVFIEDPFAQSFAASFLLTIALIAQAYVSPFTVRKHNNLEMLSLLSSQTTQLGSILYWRYPSAATMITVILMLVNLVTVLIFIVVMAAAARAHVASKAVALKSKLARSSAANKDGASSPDGEEYDMDKFPLMITSMAFKENPMRKTQRAGKGGATAGVVKSSRSAKPKRASFQGRGKRKVTLKGASPRVADK